MLANLILPIVGFASLAGIAAASAQTFKLERKVPLGDVTGRIDHMAFDPATGRLFVAELGNDSVGVVDANAGKMVHRLTGLSEPQGVAYVPGKDLLVVANGRTGEVVAYRGAGFSVAWKLRLGADADNVHVDTAASELFVGYGSGLAAVDFEGHKKRVVPLASHPEAFQLTADHVFVNVPSARQIAEVDRASGQVKTWSMQARSNFPMAIDAEAKQVLSVFRDPPRLSAFDAASGRELASAGTCGDADDVWIDRKRNRVYVSCGDGHVAVLTRDGGGLREIERLRTVDGARTSLFSPELDLLFVAVRARALEPAAIWTYRAVE